MHMARPPQQDFGHPGVGSKDKESWPQRSPASLEPKSGGGGGVGCTSQDHLGEDFGNHFLAQCEPVVVLPPADCFSG